VDKGGILSPVPRRRRSDRWNDRAFAFGRMLATARERAGISAEELSRSAGIPRRYVAYLEDGRLDLIPSVAHARGYVRTYARAVGLDADEVTVAMCRLDRRARFINRELANLVAL
jgi:transcriptional regulator with XRE-family HTH domain